MDKQFFARICILDTPRIVIPESLENLVYWLFAEKKLRLDPGIENDELIEAIELEDLCEFARRTLYEAGSDPKWRIRDQCLYEFFVLAGFTFSLRGGSSSWGTTAYNDLRSRMGLPMVRPAGPPQAEPGEGEHVTT